MHPHFLWRPAILSLPQFLNRCVSRKYVQLFDCFYLSFSAGDYVYFYGVYLEDTNYADGAMLYTAVVLNKNWFTYIALNLIIRSIITNIMYCIHFLREWSCMYLTKLRRSSDYLFHCPFSVHTLTVIIISRNEKSMYSSSLFLCRRRMCCVCVG